MSCEYCEDSDGTPLMPYHGLAPHVHTSGGTYYLQPHEYGENVGFIPDKEDETQGMWYCTHCGDGKDETIT